MKKTSICLSSLFDYIGFSLILFVVLVMSTPFHFDTYLYVSSVKFQSFCEAIVAFLSFILSDIIIGIFFHTPCDYSQGRAYLIRRVVLLFLVFAIVDTLVISYFFTFYNYGVQGYYASTTDTDGSFTLRWLLMDFYQRVFFCILFGPYAYALAAMRKQKYELQELRSLNAAINIRYKDENTEMDCSNHTVGNKGQDAEVIIQGSRNDTLSVIPHHIIYIESVSNYLNIVCAGNKELTIINFRCTLQNAREALSDYGYLFCTHRAFIVNLRFIEHVAGNSNGYRLQLSGVDKVIPVSKGRINDFKRMLEGMNAD